MSDEKKCETIYDIFKACSTEVSDTLETLHKELPFLKNGTNLVAGESKAGKTYTTIKSLIDCGLHEQIIHLDFDRNCDQKLKELKVETYHIIDRKTLYDKMILFATTSCNTNLSNKILVIDSLQDLASDQGLDTNHGALLTINNINAFKNTGATLIIIHHAKADINKKLKISGNASVITSKCDTTILFEKYNNDKRMMTVLNTRAEDKIPSGTTFEFNSSKRTANSSKTSAELSLETPSKPKRKQDLVPK